MKKVLIAIQAIALSLFFTTLSYAQLDQQELAPDVRVVIDISGSMKKNDPQNLRRPAMELLVQLFPETAKAGVWTFGQWVNMLVPHKPVTESWRKNARNLSQEINSVALHTNIPAALEKAVDDIDKLDPLYETSLILLTDGMVDVSKSPQENQRARRRIIDEILPKLRDAGVTIHTVALSNNADKELMERLAVETNGLSAVAETAEDLMAIFLQAFDAAAPAEQLPLEGNTFTVDSSIEEFTALVMRRAGSDDTILVSPDNKQYSHGKHGSDISWFKKQNYDLITVKRPYEGEWRLVADLEPNSRVTIVSNLSLATNRLPKNLFVEDDARLAAALKEQGVNVESAELLNLVDISVSVTRRDDDQRWQFSLSSDNPVPPKGIFNSSLGMLNKAGVYDIVVTADGKTFQRQQKQTVEVREAFDITVNSSDDEPPNHQVILFAQNPAIDTEKSTVIARIKRPDGSSTMKAVIITGDRRWQLDISGIEQTGRYKVNFEVTGRYLSGGQFEYSSDEVTIAHSVAGSELLVLPEPAPVVVPEPLPEPEPAPEVVAEPEEKPEPAVAPEPSPEPKAEEEDSTMQSVILYGGLALGNLLIAALGFFAYRMLMGANKSDVLDQEDEGDNIVEEPEPVVEEATAEESEPEAEAAVVSEPKPESEAEPAQEPVDDALEEALDLEEIDDLDTELSTDDTDPEEEEQSKEPGLDDELNEILDLPDDAIDIDPASDDKE